MTATECFYDTYSRFFTSTGSPPSRMICTKGFMDLLEEEWFVDCTELKCYAHKYQGPIYFNHVELVQVDPSPNIVIFCAK